MDSVKFILEAAHLRDEPQVDPNKSPVSVASLVELSHHPLSPMGTGWDKQQVLPTQF